MQMVVPRKSRREEDGSIIRRTWKYIKQHLTGKKTELHCNMMVKTDPQKYGYDLVRKQKNW